MIAMGTMNSENIYEVPATSNTGSEIKIGEDVKKGEGIKRSNKLIYLVAIYACYSVVLLAAIVGCFVALTDTVTPICTHPFDFLCSCLPSRCELA